MAPNYKKIEMWNKADFLTSRRYWKVIDWNKDLYKEASESLFSEVEYTNSKWAWCLNYIENLSSKNKEGINLMLCLNSLHLLAYFIFQLNYKIEQKIKSEDSSEFIKSKTIRASQTFREIPSVESDSKFDNESDSKV